MVSYQDIQNAMSRLRLDTADQIAAARTLLGSQPDSSDVRDAIADLDRMKAELDAAPPPVEPADRLVGTPAEAVAAAKLAGEKTAAPRAHR